jgi:predicted metal-dependent hydrolase
MGKTMQNRNIRRFIYMARHKYLTMNNAVIAIAAVIAISWAWASVGVVQKNYALQREVDDKLRQKQRIELETLSLEYEQKYYRSSEYLTLEVKKRLGLAEPGEKVLVLPANTAAASREDEATTAVVGQTATVEPTNIQQWVNFLFGGNNRRGS